MRSPSFLLVGPYDPHAGEYTFLSPPLGVWRLAGYLRAAGYTAEVFDPNVDYEAPEDRLIELVRSRSWDVIGFSTTGMTLPYDLSLAHRTRPLTRALFVAGGMEATFRPDLLFDIGPFDLVVLGEGEKPLRSLAERLERGASLVGIGGTAHRDPASKAIVRVPQNALDRDEMRDATFETPYEDMPYPRYWDRLYDAYRIGALPFKADREARLSEVRAVRFNTLNYCPMGCSFCSSTNFLHAAQGSKARVARLSAAECLQMVERIVGIFPAVRTVIFQDDIFVFTSDERILPLCDGIQAAKRAGRIPEHLEFISTNRIDSMDRERLTRMKQAGFRVLGFGVENFSRSVLAEFNKERIYPFVEPVLELALGLGLVPFLDIIIASPRSRMEDVATTLREAHRWLEAGCEVGMYPYVIPFSGAVMAQDPAHEPFTIRENCTVPGTDVSWVRPVKILPHDGEVRETILDIEASFERLLSVLGENVFHVPSRVRSLLWILSGSIVLADSWQLPDPQSVIHSFSERLSIHEPGAARRLRLGLREASERRTFA